MIYAKVPKSKVKRKAGWQAEELAYQQHLISLGINPHQKKTKPKFKEYNHTNKVVRETPFIPSLSSNLGTTAKTETTKYTGTRLIGTAVLHKSCLVPVFTKQEIDEIGHMRR